MTFETPSIARDLSQQGRSIYILRHRRDRDHFKAFALLCLPLSKNFRLK